jgi:hypothetical protein
VLPAEFRHGLSELRIAGQGLDGQRAAARSIATISVSRVQVKTQGIRRKRWFLPHGRHVRGSAPGPGLADVALEPNGPPSRDFGPQRPLTPQDKAEQAKQPSNGGGEYR